MKISYELGKRDIWDFQFHALFVNKTLRQFWLVLAALQFFFSFYSVLRGVYLLIAAGLPGEFVWLPGLLNEFTACLINFAGAMFLTALVSLMATALYALAVLNGYKENDGSLGRHLIELDEGCLREVTDVNESLHSWKSVTKIVETKNLLLIYVSPTNAHIIPKRAFADEESSRAFLDEARRLTQAARTNYSPSFFVSKA